MSSRAFALQTEGGVCLWRCLKRTSEFGEDVIPRLSPAPA